MVIGYQPIPARGGVFVARLGSRASSLARLAGIDIRIRRCPCLFNFVPAGSSCRVIIVAITAACTRGRAGCEARIRRVKEARRSTATVEVAVTRVGAIVCAGKYGEGGIWA